MDKQIKTVAAIDIGTTKIVALTGKKNADGRFEITSMGKSPSKGIKRGVVNNIEQTISSIKEAVEKLEIDDPEILKSVYVGVAGQHIRSLKNRAKLEFEEETKILPEHLEDLSKRMLNTVVEPGEEILHVIPQNYVINDKTDVENPLGVESNVIQVNAHIIIGQKSLLNNIKMCLSSININIKSLILEPLASAQAVLTTEEKENGVALVDIGGGTTDIAVFKNNTLLHTAVIPLGGNTITNDIKQEFSILEKQAEDIKIKYGQAIAETKQADVIISIEGLKGRETKEFELKNLCEVIQARMEEIIHAVLFQIDSSKYHGNLCAGIVITGGGSLLKNLKQLFKFISDYDIRIAYPKEHISGQYAVMINQPQYSTAIGLVMKGYDIEKDRAEKKAKVSETANKKETKKEREKKENNFIQKLKSGFTNLFDEEDELN